MNTPIFNRSFCLIRHGETTANRDQMIAGHWDVPLTQQGLNEALALRSFSWEHPLCIFASPLERAKMTAEIAFPDHSIILEAGLMERNWGLYEKKPMSDLPNRMETPEGGESWPDFIERVETAIRLCCDRAGGQYPVIVAHSGVIRVVRKLIGSEGWKQRAPNAQPIHFDLSNNRFLERTNYDEIKH